MTSDALDRIAERPPALQAETQTTVVEQARAVAEVRAAVLVAQQVPRDIGRAFAEMRDACSRSALADRAFYSVRNRGSGASVHLARELVRIWGNVDYGVHELRRDDTTGMSEIRAYAWDQQANNRSSRTFQVPHARMRDGERRPLTDLQDVYLNNQNVGARAVRECIFTVLPDEFVEEAKAICRRTLEKGEGEPLPERIKKMIAAFKPLGVTQAQMEQKIGRKRSAWTAADVADMGVLYSSIERRETTVADEFQQRVTTDQVTQRDGADGDEQLPDAFPEDTAARQEQL